MPGEERTTRTAERCHAHPGAGAVATCDRCGLAVCISCAVPVRGTVVGTECLSAEIGHSSDGSPAPEAPGGRGASALSGAALAVALLATGLPWTRYGRLLGGWAWPFGRAFPWSMVAAPAALLGSVVWLVGRRRGSVRRRAVALAVLGATTCVGAYLAIDIPPAFTRPWLGPYVEIAAGAVAVVAALAAAHRARSMS
ncbi:MAG: hypothetical protein HY240_02760 [Actinobacteria bacterium]|nr:hypothetical protein [Actinomycetota bacterium]